MPDSFLSCGVVGTAVAGEAANHVIDFWVGVSGSAVRSCERR